VVRGTGNIADSIIDDHVNNGEGEGAEYVMIDHDAKERQPYIYKQTKRLLNSEKISLDEKGKIIALLHDRQQQ
jgi:hypothetical protein